MDTAHTKFGDELAEKMFAGSQRVEMHLGQADIASLLAVAHEAGAASARDALVLAHKARTGDGFLRPQALEKE
jgi:hypothetical protein